MRLVSYLVTCASLVLVTEQRDIPSNVQSFYDGLKKQGSCLNKLATGFYSTDDGPNSESLKPHRRSRIDDHLLLVSSD
jgi:hypothetical protein